MRHNASAGRDYDKKVDFASPDARGGAARTASHRYLPEETKAAPAAPARARRRVDDEFNSVDFKPRWWPAPDAWQ
jgi:hypothetical protein